MADEQLINVAYVIAGGFIGSALITLFPYFNGKKNLEESQAAARAKPPEQRTPEEQYLLDAKYPSFFEEYKFRFFFGLLSGIASVLATFQGGFGDIASKTAAEALFAGVFASGFLTALADAIRNTGDKAVVAAKKITPQ